MLILWGLRVPIWKLNFCSRVSQLSVLPWCRERPQIAICCLECLGRLKCLATSLDAFLSSFSSSRRCSQKRLPSRLSVSPMYNFFQSASYTVDDIGCGTGKMIVILMDRLGPNNAWVLQLLEHVLHCAGAQLKVPGWSLIWNALLTKTLAMFFLHLNEINGGCEKLLPVLGSFWTGLKFFRVMDVTVWLWGEMWGWIKFYYYSPSETFVVVTADQFVGRDDGLLEQQRQDSHICQRNRTFPLILRENQSPHFKGKKV